MLHVAGRAAAGPSSDPALSMTGPASSQPTKPTGLPLLSNQSDQSEPVSVMVSQAGLATAKPHGPPLSAKPELKTAAKAPAPTLVKRETGTATPPRDMLGMGVGAPLSNASQASGRGPGRPVSGSPAPAVSVSSPEPQGWKVTGIRVGARAMVFNIKPPATPPIRITLTRQVSQRLEALSMQVRGGALQHALTPDRQLLASRLESLGMGRPDVTVQADGGNQNPYGYGERSRASPSHGTGLAGSDSSQGVPPLASGLDFRA